MDIIFPSMLTTSADVVGVRVEPDELLSLLPDDDRLKSDRGRAGVLVGEGDLLFVTDFVPDFPDDVLLLCDGVAECDLSMGSRYTPVTNRSSQSALP